MAEQQNNDNSNANILLKRIYLFLIGVISFFLIIVLILLFQPLWYRTGLDRVIYHPSTPVSEVGATGYAEKWVEDISAQPIHQYKVVSHPQKKDSELLSIQRLPGPGYAGFNIYLNSRLNKDDALILDIYNRGPAFDLEITLLEKKSKTCAIPEDWQVIVPLPAQEWMELRLPISRFQLNPDYQPTGKTGNEMLNLESLELISFIFNPNQHVDMLVQSITLRNRTYSTRALIGGAGLFLWYLLFLWYWKRRGDQHLSSASLTIVCKYLVYLMGVLFTIILPGPVYIYSGDPFSALIVLIPLSMLEMFALQRLNATWVKRISFVKPWLVGSILLYVATDWPFAALLFVASCFMLLAQLEIVGLVIGLVYLHFFILIQQWVFQINHSLGLIIFAVLLLLIVAFLIVLLRKHRAAHEVDYLSSKQEQMQDQITRLKESQTQLQAMMEKYEETKWKDDVTGVVNKEFFEEYFEKEWRRFSRYALPVSLIVCELDAFDTFISQYGESTKDSCLQWIAMALSGMLKRPDDLIAHTKEHRFVLVLGGTEPFKAAEFAETLKSRIDNLRITHPMSKSGYVTASLGVSGMVPECYSLPDILLHLADEAVLQAKKTGGDKIVLKLHQSNIDPS